MRRNFHIKFLLPWDLTQDIDEAEQRTDHCTTDAIGNYVCCT